MEIILLHLSDIHIKASNDPILKKGASIAKCVYSSLPSAAHAFIVISGDIAYSGETFQYSLAEGFLKEISTTIQKELPIPVSFILVPGNHDCNFNFDSGTRKMVVQSIEGSNAPEIDASIINTCTSIQKSFFDFRNNLEDNNTVSDDGLWRSSRFTLGGKVIGFDCLNISWISNRSETPGRLYFPIDLYSDKITKHIDLRVIVLHHPLNWFNQSVYRPFRLFVRQMADIVISGHEHQGTVGVIDDAESDKSVFVEGCVLQDEHGRADSSFNLVTIELDKKKFRSAHYDWDGARYISNEEGSWFDYHDLPMKQSNPFTIADSFQDMLDDPGAFFRHPGSEKFSLSDIFVYPDLRKVTNGPDRERKFVSSETLLSPELTADGILIEGDEKAGCTSLLYMLYRHYHARGFVPILLNGKSIKRSPEKEIDALIRREVEAQYGRHQIEAFDQLSMTQRILLLDDFDDGPLKAADVRAGLLCALRKRFGHLVVTVNEMFEIRELLSGDSSKELISLEHYHLQPFGYARRSQLIERWFNLAKDGTVDEAEFIARCDQAERLMNMAMTKTVIPSIPLYLLTLLQSMEAGRSGDFKESALGYYYQYLLTEAFQSSGVKPDKLTEVFQYSVQLAAEFHNKSKTELSENELRDFNTRFTEEWHTVDFARRIDLLLRARVLRAVGENFAFRYPYIYYYLKGQYLSERLADDHIRDYIRHCCKHLYVRDNANTVLFLAHHTNDDFVLITIAEALHSLFQNRSAVTFNGDTNGITRLIEDAPKLAYTGESPIQHRKNANALRDDMDDGTDGLAETEEESEELSIVAQIIALFKTTEIMGQILKNQYSKIQRTRKAVLLEELFNGPLRALRDFYLFCEGNPDALVAEIEAAMQRKGKVKDEEERKRIARKVVAGIVQIVSFAFLLRAARCANSDSLSEDIDDVVAKKGTLAFKLIDLCTHLDSPKAIPRQKLVELFKEAEKDLLAVRVIQLMAVNRLYMFKTIEQDMQWLRDKLNLDIKQQHSITYQDNKQRLLK